MHSFIVIPIISDTATLSEAVFVIFEPVLALVLIPAQFSLDIEFVCLCLGSITVAAWIEGWLYVSRGVLEEDLSWNDEGIQLICWSQNIPCRGSMGISNSNEMAITAPLVWFAQSAAWSTCSISVMIIEAVIWAWHWVSENGTCSKERWSIPVLSSR